MKLHVDLETLQLIEGPGFRNPVSSIRFKRGDAASLDVTFLDGGTTPASIGDPAALAIRFGVKPRNRYDVGYLVCADTWTMPDPEAEEPVYRCAPSFNTTELDSALGVGSSTGSELSEITLMGEITWREGSGDPTSTRTFLVVVENDVNRGTEGVPTSATPTYPAPASIELLSRKGTANGYAGLDANGKVPESQLPSMGGGGSGYELQTNKGTPGGYAGLDANGKVPEAQLPAMSGGITFDPYTLALGYSAYSATEGVAVGPSSSAYDRSTAFGFGAQAQVSMSVGIGYYANAYGYRSTAIGANSYAAAGAVAINGNASGLCSISIQGYASGDSGISIGFQSNSIGDRGTAVGAYSYAGLEGASFGYSAYVNMGVAIGGSANGSFGGTAVGNLAFSSDYSVAYGYNSRAQGQSTIAIGRNCQTSEDHSMVIAPDGGSYYGWIKTDAERRFMFSIPVAVNPPSGSFSDLANLSTGELRDGGACFQINTGATELHFFTYQAGTMRKAVIPLTIV